MDIEPLKDAHWAIVADCLKVFHGYPAGRARSAALDLRQQLEKPKNPPPGYMTELLYNKEPFYRACEIARRDLSLDDHRARYMQLTREHFAPAERLAFAGELRAAG
jgi:hypothetical protein